MTNDPPDYAFARTDFRKSRFSEPDRECVEMARLKDRGLVALRDSKTIFGAFDDRHLIVPDGAVASLVGALKTPH